MMIMKGYSKNRLYRLGSLLAVMLFLVQGFAWSQEQSAEVVSSGGGFTSGGAFSSFIVAGGGPVSANISGGDYTSAVGFVYANASEPREYVLTAEAFPPEGGLVTGAGVYQSGEFVDVTATAETGWVFIGWGAPAGSFGDVNEPATVFTMPSGDVVYTAYFAEATDTVTTTSFITVDVNPQEFGTISGSGEYLNGSTLNLTAVAEQGYRFISWTDGDVIVSTSAEYSFTVEGDLTLTANYAPVDYTVSLQSAPENNIGGAVTGSGKYSFGSEVTVTASPNVGFAFEGWIENGDTVSNSANYTFTVTGDRELTGAFSGEQYTVTTGLLPDATGNVIGAGDYYEGDIVTLTATPADGYYFVRWMEGDEQVSVRNPYLFSATADRDLTAEFAVKWWDDKGDGPSKNSTYLVTATTDPAGVGVVLGQGLYNEGEEVTLTASPNTGISFVKWLENGEDVVDGGGSLVGASYTFTAVADRELVAVFDGATYAVSTSSDPVDAGTLVVSSGGSFFPGDLAEVSAEAAGGFEFLNWTLGADGPQVSVNPDYAFTVSQDADLVAHFVAKQSYDLSVTVVPLGSATATGAGTYLAGEEASLDIAPAEGYEFVYWASDVELISYDPATVLTVDSDLSLVAYLQEQTFQLAYATEGAGSIAGDSLQIVTYGNDGASVEAVPDNCAVFTQWSDGVTDAVRTDLAVVSDLSVIALFESVEVDATITSAGDSLTANYADAAYQWVDCNNGNQAIDGAVGRSFTPSVSGTYAVMITDGNCQVMSECVEVTVDVTGIYDPMQDAFGLNVYPNPARGAFMVDAGQPADLEIINSLGEVVQSLRLTETNGFKLQVEGLSSGMYVLVGRSGDEVITKKVILTE